jgi:hypothetical protein
MLAAGYDPFRQVFAQGDVKGSSNRRQMMKLSMLLALSWGTFSMTPTWAADLPPQIAPIYGGSTGTSFSRSCNSGQVLTGFRHRVGWLWVDAVGLLCRPVNSDGTLGSETSVGSMAGGGGGTSGSDSCPAGSVVAWVSVAYGSFVNGVHFFCRIWDPATRSFLNERVQLGFGKDLSEPRMQVRCENTKQPVHGIRGRFGWYVDAMGIVCDEP